MLKILLSLSFVFSTFVYASSKKVKKGAVVLTLVDGQTLHNETTLIRELDRDIDLIIDTSGGYVEEFTSLGKSIKYIQRRGRKVNCYIKKAYSMGFYIMSMCDKRYFYRNAVVMTHNPYRQVRSGTVVTVKIARELLNTAKRLHTQIQKTFKTIKYKQFVTQEAYLTVPMLLQYTPKFVDGLVDNDRKVLCTSTAKCKKLSSAQVKQPNTVIDAVRLIINPSKDLGPTQ